jgi:hypothetical protein
MSKVKAEAQRIIKHAGWRLALCVPALCFTPLSPPPASGADAFTPVYHPELVISRAAGAIEVDADLGDAGWQGAAEAGNFAEHSPGDQTEPAVDTRVLVTYDDRNLYVAWLCFDDPGAVRASFCQRDNIFQDDNVLLCLDTFGESTIAYEIAANPYGIQGDLLFSPAVGEDATYDMIYQAAGRTTDQGYVIEMAIPFSSMRFPACEEQVWRVDFWRNRPRQSRYQYSWAAYDRDEACWPCQWGTLKGIRGVRPSAGLQILPAAIAHEAGSLDDQDRFGEGRVKGDAGLGLAYGFSSELTAEATVNPDFSQVESDVAQIDVNSTFALFYPERRPFFQEGSDLFSTYFTAVYTRSINDPLVAGKLTWRRGRNSLAVLSARDEHSVLTLPFEETSEFVENGRSVSNLLRARKDLGEQSHLGMVATDRRFDDGGSGSIFGADGRLRLSKNDSFKFQVLATYTDEVDNVALGDTSWKNTRFDDGRHTVALDGETFWGHGWFASLDHDTRHYGFGADYMERSPTFRADNGLEPSNNSRTTSAWAWGIVRFEESRILDNVQFSTSGGSKWNFAGTAKERWADGTLQACARIAQTSMHAQYVQRDEHFGGRRFDGTWLVHNCMHTQPWQCLGFSANITYGHLIARRYLVVGKDLTCGASAEIRPLDRMLATLSFSRKTSDRVDTGEGLFSQTVIRGRFSAQISRELSARLVLQYNSRSDRCRVLDADPLVTYQVNPFTIFYVGSARDYKDLESRAPESEEEAGPSGWTLTGRQYFMKVQYLFRI